jgi:hypothetical protein
MLDGVV